MPPVNSMDYSGKDTVLDVIRKESTDFFALVDDPSNWNVQTRCTEWEVRDMVGHMLDVTEGYLTRWESARNNEPRDTVGLLVMSRDLNDHAQAFRTLPREEAIARLKEDYGKMMDTFEKLTPEELSAGSLLQTLETRFGLKLRSATQRINAALADPYLAKLLNVRVGSPMLSIERAVYAGGAAPVYRDSGRAGVDQPELTDADPIVEIALQSLVQPPRTR